jgi:peptidoglycan hydrolase-like protein with peptidoglycan-binding domain
MRRIALLVCALSGLAAAQTFQSPTPTVQPRVIVHPSTTAGSPQVVAPGPTFPSPGTNMEITPNRIPTVEAVPVSPGPAGSIVNRTQLTPLLQPGSIGQAQVVLTSMGLFQGPITNTMTGPTRAALRAFQTQFNLPATGELDLQTAQALGLGNVSATSVLPQSNVPSIVVRSNVSPTLAAQQSLVALGLLAPTAATGIANAQTTAAVVAFQESVGLPASGILDAGTVELLQNQLSISDNGAIPTVTFRTDIPTVQP